MNNNTIAKIWFFAAICFFIVGVGNKNTVFIILGCSYICIGCSKLSKETKNKDNIEK